ncbi:hypothetical protein ABZY44_17665 [Streptomyces sp. NPDC006544]|uniref:hypothetical protein n=1 Tax=Streptomyces sp. NPDC006544 TaxID=3154583 RepID=UPI0033B504EA
MTTTTTYLASAASATRTAALLITNGAHEDIHYRASRLAGLRRQVAELAPRPDGTEEVHRDLDDVNDLLDKAADLLGGDVSRKELAEITQFLDAATELLSCARMLVSAALNERFDRQAAERGTPVARPVRTPEEMAAEEGEEIRQLVRIAIGELLKALPGLRRFKRDRADS